MAENPKYMSTRKMYLLLLAIIVLIVVGGCWAPGGLDWVIIAAAMVAFIMGIGRHVCDRSLGVLIDERNQMSLSRFQLILWTIIVLSAYVAMVSKRVVAPTPIEDPLAVKIPDQLWALMGISVSSLVGASLIRRRKLNKEISEDQKSRMPPSSKEPMGTNYIGDSEREAEFFDIFRGDEVVDHTYVDMAKVQMFFFTIVAALVYVIGIFGVIANHGDPSSFGLPPVPESLLALLGISHAGYLGEKAIDTTKTKPIAPR